MVIIPPTLHDIDLKQTLHSTWIRWPTLNKRGVYIWPYTRFRFRSRDASKPTQLTKKTKKLNFKYFIVHRLNMHVNMSNLYPFIESSWSARTKASMVILWSNKFTQSLQLQSPAPMLPWACKWISNNRESAKYHSLPPLISCYSINLIHKCIECTLIAATSNNKRFPPQYHDQIS